VDRD